MGYQAAAERLWPGEAEGAFLPWAFMRDEDKERLTTQPHACADCGLDDLPYVAGTRLDHYCYDLRQSRRA
jgi:hypothetical protein